MIKAGEYQRGETIVFRFGVDIGNVADVTELPTAKLKPLAFGTTVIPSETVASVANFAVAAAAADLLPAGWLFSLTPAQTLALPVGQYICNARFVLGADVQTTLHLVFTLVESVTKA